MNERANSSSEGGEATTSIVPGPGGEQEPRELLAGRPMAELPLLEGAQTVIGRYRLLEKIGEGGFGVVYVAEQKTPVRRRVALKIIKLGMDTRSVVARFEAERQALAMMDHPNIAKVLDAGATDTGRPYFVMELVRGIPITAYCNQNHAPPEQRLKLFIDVCHAIQHAHQKGVIHRDIKPSNILVTAHDGVPVPKVIDFGIAKATQGDLTDKTIYTMYQQFIGTPAYMSPEQAEMSALDVDTRSDIYSLGVLLYELLTGTTPFDAKELAEAGMDEMRRRIRETEPMRPSNRISGMTGVESTTRAKQCGIEAHRLISLLRGDLDWVVMKCLEKDRTRRYETANGVAMDIQRYMSNEPIAARPPSATYRIWKMARRNKLAAAATGAVVLAILAGMGIATVGFFRASVERQRAETALVEAQRQRELADKNFGEARAAVDDLLQISDERLKDQPGLQTLRAELMKAVIDRYEPFLGRPVADPRPRAELARLYARYGQLMLERTEELDAGVLAMFEKARALQDQLLQEHPGDRALRSDLGWTLILEEWRLHQLAPLPVDAGRRAVEVFRGLVADDPKDPFARDDLVWALWRLSAFTAPEESKALVAEAVKVGEQLVSDYPASAEFRRELANALSLKANIMLRTSRTPEVIKEAVSIRLRVLELSKSILADLKSGKPEPMLPERPKEDEGRMFSNSPMWAEFDVADHSWGLAKLYRTQNDWDRAGRLFDEATAGFRDLVERNPSVATFDLGLVDVIASRLDVAENANDPKAAAACSKDAVSFWSHQWELHPELPALKKYADDAKTADAGVVKWLEAKGP